MWLLRFPLYLTFTRCRFSKFTPSFESILCTKLHFVLESNEVGDEWGYRFLVLLFIKVTDLYFVKTCISLRPYSRNYNKFVNNYVQVCECKKKIQTHIDRWSTYNNNPTPFIGHSKIREIGQISNLKNIYEK